MHLKSLADIPLSICGSIFTWDGYIYLVNCSMARRLLTVSGPIPFTLASERYVLSYSQDLKANEF